MKAIILAAGKGSRLHPLTAETPKPLIEVGGKAILDHIIENLPDKIDEVLLITEHLEHKIHDHVAMQVEKKVYRPKISIFSQGQDRGTYGALLTIKNSIKPGEKFLVMNGDDLHEKSELTDYLQYPLASGIQKRIMPAYYASEPDPDSIIRKFRAQTEEEKIHGAYIATGVYLLDDRIFSFTPVKIFGDELGLPQTLIAQSDQYPLHAVITTKWQPINNFDDLEQAKKRFV